MSVPVPGVHPDDLAFVYDEMAYFGENCAEFGLAEPSDEIRAYARFVLQIQLLVTTSPTPIATLEAGFRVLDQGWESYVAGLPG